ncbi:Protein-(glutamine-N5) methyltransferase [Elusimicrobium minutum Pei191]|uniref:Release factor glutamine methyltransferase n=1 Tax=Elusimicrobium minutum (strain Pei191) TaxID=445932 RepID=B2KDQ0_ELUMP|nr:peptide chain release factor N(5)-glutamine methyltransferase [Elusimicrobium minutum]ACC98646.1 Protein-(glutamine-N5) methyltransferase [Elusimicrobium minutum Pei191]
MASIKELLSQAKEILKKNSIDEIDANAEFLLAHVLNLSRGVVLSNQEREVGAEDAQKYFDFINKRLLGMPLAYITGTQDFCGHTFIVDSDVLVPRPETEELVEISSSMLGKPKRILDMCTGSGCIACSMAMKYRSAQVTGVDNSMAALLTAEKNVKKFGLQNVELIYGDLFENIYGAFDLIITNPPYIPTGDLAGLSREVKEEPQAALDGGENGLDIITQIILYAPDFLETGGLLTMEYGINREREIEGLFDKNIWRSVEVKKDMFGIYRFVFAQKA